MASRYGLEPAIFYCHSVTDSRGSEVGQLSYDALQSSCDALAHGLTRIGVTRGMRTIVMLQPGIDFFAVTFALFKIGAVPVLIDPGMGKRNVARCLATVEAEAFIGVSLAHVLRTL